MNPVCISISESLERYADTNLVTAWELLCILVSMYLAIENIPYVGLKYQHQNVIITAF